MRLCKVGGMTTVKCDYLNVIIHEEPKRIILRFYHCHRRNFQVGVPMDYRYTLFQVINVFVDTFLYGNFATARYDQPAVVHV